MLRSDTCELLFNRIYDIAKTDFESANILAKNSLYPQTIYFCSQACEKAAKSVIAMYLIQYEKKTDEEVLKILKSHGHNLLKLAETTTKIFVEYEKGLYVKRGGKETDRLIRTANESIKKIQGRKPDIQDLMAYYAGNVKVLYERLYG
jgi:HEPN domain-containing protein